MLRAHRPASLDGSGSSGDWKTLSPKHRITINYLPTNTFNICTLVYKIHTQFKWNFSIRAYSASPKSQRTFNKISNGRHKKALFWVLGQSCPKDSQNSVSYCSCRCPLRIRKEKDARSPLLKTPWASDTGIRGLWTGIDLIASSLTFIAPEGTVKPSKGCPPTRLWHIRTRTATSMA